MRKSVEIHVTKLFISITFYCSLSACQPQTTIEGPPSVPISLSINEEIINIQTLLKETTEDPQGAEAIRRVLMKTALIKRSKSLGGHDSPSNVKAWHNQLPETDQPDAELFAWASQIIHLKSLDQASLQKRFKRMFPQSYRLVGKVIRLTPKQVWTEDHYQRHLGSLRSIARLKLGQLRHQVIEGKRFGELASEESHHASQKQQGSITLNTLRSEGFSPRLIRVISELRPGELSPVLQDERGMYVFINEGQERPVAIDAEGVFLPKNTIQHHLRNPQFWTLLESLCDQSNQCDLSQLFPAGPSGEQWRIAWRTTSKEGQLSQRDRARRNRRRKRLSKKAKGDTRQLSGRSQSWSSLDPQLFQPLNAQYQAQISTETLEALHTRDRSFVFERAPLFKALPIMLNSEGAWLIRLKGRTIIPALSTPKLKMISLDLTRRGLQTHWGTWGVDRIGQLLSSAAQSHRLDEALSTLGIESTPIFAKDLSPQILKQLLSVSLDTGSQVITYNAKDQQVIDDSEHGQRWTLVELLQREKVQFAQVKAEIINDFQTEKKDVAALRLALEKLWQSLKVTFYVSGQELNLDKSQSRGFSRQVQLHLDQ